jgi:molybdate transport system substrate-binding protein
MRTRRSLRILTAIFGTFLLSGCGGNSDSPNRPNGIASNDGAGSSADFIATEAGPNPAATPGTLPEAEAARVLTVGAAADLRYVFDELRPEFARLHPEVELRVTFGSSGQLATQIERGAPFDLFLSADEALPTRLVKAGIAEPADAFPYARGYIVAWFPRSSKLQPRRYGLELLTDPRVAKLAIANPRHAPYGQAARAALKSLGFWERVEPKLVLGENISQTAQFVDTAAADAGIIAKSLAVAPNLRERGVMIEIPPDSYPPLIQTGLILRRAEHRAAAESLRTLLTGERGRAILSRFGFGSPG